MRMIKARGKSADRVGHRVLVQDGENRGRARCCSCGVRRANKERTVIAAGIALPLTSPTTTSAVRWGRSNLKEVAADMACWLTHAFDLDATHFARSTVQPKALSWAIASTAASRDAWDLRGESFGTWTQSCRRTAAAKISILDRR
jgi:hypothetical protein